jgi:HEPN domain-containing protein
MDKKHQFVKAPLSLANAHSYSARTIEDYCDKMALKTEEEKHRKVGMIISSVVLRALALELYLKSLCFCLDGKERKGHELSDLFGEIPDAGLRADVAQRFEEKTGQDLSEFLEEIDNAFVAWRYVHESLNQGIHMACDTGQMDELSRILCEIVNQLL